RSRRRSATRGAGAREWPPRRGGGSAGRARRIGGARRAGRLLRPSGAESILATLSTGCARFARSTRGNQPPPLRGGFHIGDAIHGWSDAEGGAQPVEGARIVEPPRRGGGSARSARRIGGARRAGRLLRPSGAESILA